MSHESKKFTKSILRVPIDSYPVPLAHSHPALDYLYWFFPKNPLHRKPEADSRGPGVLVRGTRFWFSQTFRQHG